MKILHIGKYGEISEILKKEAENRGHIYTILSSLNINIEFNSTLIIKGKSIDLLDFDIYYFRGIKRNLAEIIAMYLKSKGKIVIDEDLSFKKILDFKNIYPPTSNIFIQFPPFILFPNKQNIESFEYPAILKDTYGKKGRNVYFVKSSKEVQKIMLKHNDITFMLQKYIDAKKEIRTIFIGDEILPLGMEKINDTNIIKNIYQGAIGKKYVLNDKEITITKNCKLLTKLDIGGVDLIQDQNNKYFVLEINRAPVFLEFNKATGIKVEEKIIDFMEQKCNYG